MSVTPVVQNVEYLYRLASTPEIPDNDVLAPTPVCRWKEGRTGMPLVDANMRELAATGFMSNRGRQNVASYLVHDLGLDWRLGADWFEHTLIDYDVASNWGASALRTLHIAHRSLHLAR